MKAIQLLKLDKFGLKKLIFKFKLKNLYVIHFKSEKSETSTNFFF
jgi:hypothetical protein